MATEVELKARLSGERAAEVRAVLDRRAVWRGTFEKRDVYWFSRERDGSAGSITDTERTLPPSGLRLRKETLRRPDGTVENAAWLTYKTKEVRDGMEINDERECAVTPVEPFEALLPRLGLEPGAVKTKRGRSYDADGITAELVEVEGLGWFIELEILFPGPVELPGASGVPPEDPLLTARRRLLALLASLGVDESALEPRYYTEMLRGIERDS